MKRLSIILAAVMLLACVPAISFGAQAASGFTDVNQNDWFYNDVKACSEQGIFEGYPDGSFKPKRAITFAELITLVARTAGLEKQPLSWSTHWASGTVDNAFDRGWWDIREVKDFERVWNEQSTNKIYTLDYNAPVTRELAAKIIAMALYPSISGGADAYISDQDSINKDYVSCVRAGYEYGIFEGDSGTNAFRPKATLSRAEMCALMLRISSKGLNKSQAPLDTLLATGDFTYGGDMPGLMASLTKSDPQRSGISVYVGRGSEEGAFVMFDMHKSHNAFIDSNTFKCLDGVSACPYKYGVDENGVCHFVDGRNYQNRMYVKSLIKLIFPTEYQAVWDSLADTVMGKNEGTTGMLGSLGVTDAYYSMVAENKLVTFDYKTSDGTAFGITIRTSLTPEQAQAMNTKLHNSPNKPGYNRVDAEFIRMQLEKWN